ncbi:MAG: HNH endonuclease [Phenylobacterium sp.]|nr:HNH endonuclease [Phenylobacterium sp.]
MTVLRNLRPPVGGLPDLLRRTDAHGHDEGSQVRAWYKSAEWRRTRVRVFERDDYTCQWEGCGLIVARPHADHISPHRGDRALFFDDANVQTLCPPHHNSAKQRQERAARQGGEV